MSEHEINVLMKNRKRGIVKASLVSVVVNIAIAFVKAVMGITSNSLAVMLDAVNSITDALSYVIIIIGVKLGSKKPNKRHPLGYGRIEYLSSMVVAAIVLYAGITSIVESVKKIVNPVEVHYSRILILIIALTIIIKILLGRYIKKEGEKYNSIPLISSGSEVVFDTVVSVSVIISAVVHIVWNVSLEAYAGVLIALAVIRIGLKMMIETLDNILGKRNSNEDIELIKGIICEEIDVRDAYDLILFNYGPNKNYASVHIELPDVMTVQEVDGLTRRIQENVFVKTGTILTGIGVYSYNTLDAEAVLIREDVEKIVLSHEWALQMHGFYLNVDDKIMHFDVVITFDIDYKEARKVLTEEVKMKYPEYSLHIVPDIDI